jgi:signal transduction histidine kinase
VDVLRAIERIQRRRLLVLAVGVALEAVAMSVIGTDDAIQGIRGIGGETAVVIAVLSALLAGPLVGALVAVGGWALFWPLVADTHPGSLVALPVWTLAAVATGMLSSALVRVNRERAISERRAAAAHALRAPIATIHGLVEVLQTREPSDEAGHRIIRSIEDETTRLLQSEVFE